MLHFGASCTPVAHAPGLASPLHRSRYVYYIRTRLPGPTKLKEYESSEKLASRNKLASREILKELQQLVCVRVLSYTDGSNSFLRSDIMNVLPEPHRAYSPTQIGGSARLSIAVSACAKGCGDVGPP